MLRDRRNSRVSPRLRSSHTNRTCPHDSTGTSHLRSLFRRRLRNICAAYAPHWERPLISICLSEADRSYVPFRISGSSTPADPGLPDLGGEYRGRVSTAAISPAAGV